MEESSDLQRLKAAFQIKCKKCGSENISFHVDGGKIYYENPPDPGSLTIVCNDCEETFLIFFG